VSTCELYALVCANQFYAEEATTYTWAKPRNGRGFVIKFALGQKLYFYEKSFSLIKLCFFSRCYTEHFHMSTFSMKIWRVSRPIWCVFLRPLQVLLPSAAGWNMRVQFLQPADTLRYQCGPAHWLISMTNTSVCLPNLTKTQDRELTAFWGGGGTQRSIV